MKNSIWSILIASLMLSLTARPIYAVSTPTFPSCANPQGEIKVSYSDGTHGIVGSSDTFTGRDAVYTLSDDTVTQCFCSVDGKGIQTDWWKASSLTEDEVAILKSQGWIYVPAGNLWGLADAPYVAKNTSYSCLPTSSSTPTPNNDGNHSSDPGSSSSQDNGTGGGGEVLGLAATGDSIYVYGSFALGALLLILGIARVTKNK